MYLVSDLLANLDNLTLKMEVIDFSGKKIRTYQQKTDLEANISKIAWKNKTGKIMSESERKNAFIKFTLTDNKGKELNKQIYFVNKTKDLNLPAPEIKVNTKINDGVYEITLSTDKIAKDLFIEFPIHGARFSDNFFDLLPREKRKIIITSPEIKKSMTYKPQLQHIQKTIKKIQ